MGGSSLAPKETREEGPPSSAMDGFDALGVGSSASTRRRVLGGALACAAGALLGPSGALPAVSPSGRWTAGPSAARAQDGDPHLELVDLRLGAGEAPFGGRVPMLVPRHLAPGARVPLVIALHGLGESQDPVLAARAWPELYGLVESYRRLLTPPLAPRSRRGDLPADRIAAINGELSQRPFGGMVVACPFTPNPSRARDRGAHLDAYARWLVDTVVVRARAQLPQLRVDPGSVHVAGCSMGGTVALDVVARSAGAFGALSVVQSAHGAHRTEELATMLTRSGPGGRPLPTQVLTSRGDPFRERNEALARALAASGVPHELRVLPGPHDQPWLREAGTPEMLLWLDRRGPGR